MEEIKLYTFTTNIPWSGGMALVAAHSIEEAKGFINADDEDLITFYEFDHPEEVPNCHYTGKPGIIRWGAWEG